MHFPRIKLIKWIIVFAAILTINDLRAQEADNEFTIDAIINAREELRYGGFSPDSTNNENLAHFIMGQCRLNIGYKRSWLELRVSPQWSGVWGQASGNLNLAEGWAKMQTKHGLFAKIGRQELEYDDERILGYDDWSMTDATHDGIKFGYEGYGHKVHIILAYNQNSENKNNGTTYYSGGIQPYKSMQTLWYHYDTPKSFYGISLIGMNIGMQNEDPKKPKTYYQQIVGTYMTMKPKYTSIEGAFYYQMGKEEHGIPLCAFMGSVKATVKPSDIYAIYTGYDYLSGDDYFAVSPNGWLGLTLHKNLKGFNSIFGTHHDFYGAMDFFYVDSYVGSFTPGLQNLYLGGYVNPIKTLNIEASYHFYAIASNLPKLKKPLGHEIDLQLSYDFGKFVTLSAGYSYMLGTETMEVLQRVSEKRRLHWAWIMINVSPTIFTTTWQDKKKQ